MDPKCFKKYSNRQGNVFYTIYLGLRGPSWTWNNDYSKNNMNIHSETQTPRHRLSVSQVQIMRRIVNYNTHANGATFLLLICNTRV